MEHADRPSDDPGIESFEERLKPRPPAGGDEPAEDPQRPGTLKALSGPPTAGYGSQAAVPGAAPGQVVAGRYVLEQQLGAGGMGAVWVAKQTEPIKRRVALKLIKPGMDSAQVLARFEAERQALALMNHPNIAKVLDAGTTDRGHPFFVMELVKGVPLTKFCDDATLSVAERLAVFVQICQAVQHAHQKGIIHRDLKPANVLVESHDGRPVVKVIDFGLAKALSGVPLSEHSVLTQFGMAIGTWQYMAPEQAEVSAIDVDTRADVYALGVILYELLTGTTPLEKERLAKEALDKIRQFIKETDPPPPSARLSTAATLPDVAARRGVEPASLGRLVKGDLDWIVMKALAKERDRRYQTANAFAADVQRHLADEPVIARPPSSLYKARKFVRRNRPAVLAAGVVLLALVGGTVGTTWGMIEARRHYLAAEQARKDEADRADAEARAKQLAQQRLRQLDKSNDLLAAVFRDLDPRDDEKSGEPLGAVLAKRLAAVARELEGEAAGDELAVARLRYELGCAYRGLGYPGQAREQLQKSLNARAGHLGSQHSDTLAAKSQLAKALIDAADANAAVPLLEELLNQLENTRNRDEQPYLSTMNSLAMALQDAGRLKEAVSLYERMLEATRKRRGPRHAETLTAMNNFASALREAGRLGEAVALFKNVLDIRTAEHGSDARATLTSNANLANALGQMGNVDEAVAMHEDVLNKLTATLGPNHPETLLATNNLGMAFRAARRLDKALPLLEKSLAARKDRLGATHRDTLTAKNNLALALLDGKQLQRAIPLFEQALGESKAVLGIDHQNTMMCMGNLASAYRLAGDAKRAIELFRETLGAMCRNLGERHPMSIQTRSMLADALRDANRHPEALVNYEQVAAQAKANPKAHGAIFGVYIHDLAKAYDRAGRSDEAEAVCRELVAQSRNPKRPLRPGLDVALAMLGDQLLKSGKFAEATPVLEERWRSRAAPKPDDWATFNAQSKLGASLAGQNKYADAEPVLKAGYEGLAERAAAIPAEVRAQRLREAAERLVRLYEATNRPAEAERWRKEKAKWETPPAPAKKAG